MALDPHRWLELRRFRSLVQSGAISFSRPGRPGWTGRRSANICRSACPTVAAAAEAPVQHDLYHRHSEGRPGPLPRYCRSSSALASLPSRDAPSAARRGGANLTR